MDDIPVLYATRHPRSGHWLVDTNADYVRAAATHEGAEVVTLDVPGLLRAVKAAQQVRRSVAVSDLVLATAARLSAATVLVEAAPLADLVDALAALAAGAGEGEK